jgi:signal transduction histidine kinase
MCHRAPVEEREFEAHHLVSQLRTVARRLPGGLDPVTLAETTLRRLTGAAPYDHAEILVRTGGMRLVPLARAGPERAVHWSVSLADDTPFAEAWTSQEPQVVRRQLTPDGASARTGSGMVLPLRLGVRSFGLLGLETARVDAYPPAVARAALAMAEQSALPLETALLFDEVRGVATAEERRRLAREIHDGVAQEIASLGYLVDGLVAAAEPVAPTLTGPLSELRDELSRVVGDLRLSIFDLRSDVDRHGGLGAALSDHVRDVGRDSDLTVHLSLDEAPARLPAETEAELLRIAQEAVANVRKHARARNLWVSCKTEPPAAWLVIEDDGIGVGERRRQNSFGLEVMAERADRLRASLHVVPRLPTGTRVEVRLGAPAPIGTSVSGTEDGSG